jgi:integrase/recombinase XerD
MATLKVLLYKNKSDQTEHPIAIRITQDRASKYMFTGIYLEEKHWDKESEKVRKSHPQYREYNNLILNKRTEADNLIFDIEKKKAHVSASQIKKQIKRDVKNITFFKFAEEYFSDLSKAKRFHIESTDRGRLKNFKEFLKNHDLFFQDITVALLTKFQVFLKAEKDHKKRTIANHLLLIRTLYNKAISEGVIEKEYYPFGKEKVQIRFPESMKVGLDKEEVKAIEDLELEEGSIMWHTRNVWLIEFYFAGMRVSDALLIKWSDMPDERFYYTMHKNDKPVSIKIPDKVKQILIYYKKDKRSEDDFVFPDMKSARLTDQRDVQRKINTAKKKFNKYLKRIAKLSGIKKNLSSHIARHTFGNIAGDKIHPIMLQKLYRHSDLRTTIGYQANFITKPADEALDAVINF